MSDKAEDEVREVVQNWAKAVREANMEGVLAQHTDDIVMFDVPQPLHYKGLGQYKKTWDVFFEAQGEGAFYLEELEVAVSDTVAYCHSIVTCGTKEKEGQFKVRLTLGLRKIDGQWMIMHEHHSVPAE